jgi:1-acyl-sn-glycerol-3-phosphate acyltransferase
MEKTPMLSADTADILGICVVTAVGAGVIGWVVSMLRRSPFTPTQSVLYAVNYVFVRILWRARFHDSFPIPPDRGAVIVCNHRCPLDPSFIALLTPRVIHWMVAREYCDYPPFRRLLKMCGAIPVRRGGVDMAAVREAIRLVRQGELVGMFPEGRINTTEDLLLPGRPGAAMVALNAHAPVVPCYIDGAPYDGTTLGCLFMPASVRLMVGQPLDLSAYFDRNEGRETQNELTRRFMEEIARLAELSPGTADTRRSCPRRCETPPRRSDDGRS